VVSCRGDVEQVVRLRTGQWDGDALLQVVLGHDGRLLVSRDQGNVVWSQERGAPSSMARVVPLAEAASRAQQPAGREHRDAAASHHPAADRWMRRTTALSPLLSLHQEVCSRTGGYCREAGHCLAIADDGLSLGLARRTQWTAADTHGQPRAQERGSGVVVKSLRCDSGAVTKSLGGRHS